MSEKYAFAFPCSKTVKCRAHVGVVSSGDLEILLRPGETKKSRVEVTTRIPGQLSTWTALLQRFFDRHPFCLDVDIRDSGATPGVVWLRMEQALEAALELQDSSAEVV